MKNGVIFLTLINVCFIQKLIKQGIIFVLSPYLFCYMLYLLSSNKQLKRYKFHVKRVSRNGNFYSHFFVIFMGLDS